MAVANTSFLLYGNNYGRKKFNGSKLPAVTNTLGYSKAKLFTAVKSFAVKTPKWGRKTCGCSFFNWLCEKMAELLLMFK